LASIATDWVGADTPWLELANQRVPRRETSGCELEKSARHVSRRARRRRVGAVIDVHLRGF
jgi:hypothetical protein